MMIATSTAATPTSPCIPESEMPTIWGLTPLELHDRFWAARGVQVVRQGELSELVEDAELFLLLAPRLLTVFGLAPLVEELSWLKPDLLQVRVRDQRDRGYREVAIADEDGYFQGFHRDYGGADSRLSRVALTPSPHVARLWQQADLPRTGWQILRDSVPRAKRLTLSARGRTYDRNAPNEVMDFTRFLVQSWKRPDTTIDRAQRQAKGVWTDREIPLSPQVQFVGSVWVGAGRTLDSQTTIVGPAVLWDDPEHRPDVGHVRWDQLEPRQAYETPLRRPLDTTVNRLSKRMFDIVFAGLVLLLVLPIFPVVMFAIWLEDGRPFFFAHRRETTGGREFPCLKFRSMRNDAEKIKAHISGENQVDGPQFYIENDPRITRVGRFLRATQIDELPQFINVLLGHMSVVGPRPSPFKENQYCPAWREARLSIRPGVTGLWQVMRTREAGQDFQEWIRYDIEYVENASIRLDLRIIFKTFAVILRKK